MHGCTPGQSQPAVPASNGDCCAGSDDEEEDAAHGKAAALEHADTDSDQSTADHEEGIVPKAATLQKDDS